MPVRGAQRTRLRRQGLGGNPVDNQMDNPDERAGGRAARTDHAWSSGSYSQNTGRRPPKSPPANAGPMRFSGKMR